MEIPFGELDEPEPLPTTIARFASKCKGGCGNEIYEGELLKKVDDDWVCTDCWETAEEEMNV
jgi:hypothetical protein